MGPGCSLSLHASQQIRLGTVRVCGTKLRVDTPKQTAGHHVAGQHDSTAMAARLQRRDPVRDLMQQRSLGMLRAQVQYCIKSLGGLLCLLSRALCCPAGGGASSLTNEGKLSFGQLGRLPPTARLQIELLEVLVVLAEAPSCDLVLPRYACLAWGQELSCRYNSLL